MLGVSDEVLDRLCRAVHYPPEFFYQRDELHGIDTSILFHRKRAIPVRALAKIHAIANIRRLNLGKLLKSVDLEPRHPFPSVDIDEFDGDPRAVAQAVRATWIMPRGPVDNVTKAIEDAGGIVIRCDFNTRLVDAISQWIPGLPPMFFVNVDVPGDRLRWTLAHEIGHVVMHRSVTPNIEKEADLFASHFLMPADDIRPYLADGIVTPARLATLKPLWKASMQAILKQSTNIGVIDERQARYVWMQFGQAGYRTREPQYLDIPVEEPRTLQEVVAAHTDRLGFSAADLGRVMNLYESDVREIYLGKYAGLRIVK